MRVFVLLFNARTDNEGIHTLKVGDRNVVLMFETEDDAIRFGLMLEAQDMGNPTTEAFDSEEIEEFCNSADYECQIVPDGMLAMPPATNVEETDWQVESDRSSNAQLDEKPDFSTYELDTIRKRLEGLL